jgi:type III pantothenate kinase
LAARNPPPIFHKTTLPDSLKNENE